MFTNFCFFVCLQYGISGLGILAGLGIRVVVWETKFSIKYKTYNASLVSVYGDRLCGPKFHP